MLLFTTLIGVGPLRTRVAELGKRSTDPDPRNFSSDHVFTERVVSGNHNLDPLFLSGGGTLEHAPLDRLEQSVSSGSAAVIGRYRESSCSL